MSIAPLRFVDHGGIDTLKLVEVPEALLTSLKAGGVLTLLGQPDDDVVLCSDTTTYQLRETENSNTCFLVPQLSPLPPPPTSSPTDPPAATSSSSSDTPDITSLASADLPKNAIVGIVTRHYDLVAMTPRTSSLKSLFTGGHFTAAHDALLFAAAGRILGAEAAKVARVRVTTADIDALLGSVSAAPAAASATSAAATNPGPVAKRARSSTGGSPPALPRLVARSNSDLAHLIQASSAELSTAIAAAPLLRLGRYYVLLAPAFFAVVADAALMVLGSEGFGIERIPTEKLIVEMVGDGVCSPFAAAHVIYSLLDHEATKALSLPPPAPVAPSGGAATSEESKGDTAAAAAAAAAASASASGTTATTAVASEADAAAYAAAVAAHKTRLAAWEAEQAEPAVLLEALPRLALPASLTASASSSSSSSSSSPSSSGAGAGVWAGGEEPNAPFAPSLRLPRRVALCRKTVARFRAKAMLTAKPQYPANEFLR